MTIMLDQKIINAMQTFSDEPLSASTRASLWQARDKAMARHHELESNNPLIAGMTLIAQKSNAWGGFGLFAGAVLMAMVATGNDLLPFSNVQQAGAIECLTCQIDNVCRL